jgi:DNA-directed RNA polymerase I subunit RPA1
MGKRVNYAARSVISPDPYLETDEIGVPQKFARNLTFAQAVTGWNVAHLMQLVINGPDVHPGANYVENENGTLIDLSRRNAHQRLAISKTLLTKSVSVERNFSELKTSRLTLIYLDI